MTPPLCGYTCYRHDPPPPLELGNPPISMVGFRQRMYVCDLCGHKRCPRATDCTFSCTGSNEPGQVGSMYASQVSLAVG